MSIVVEDEEITPSAAPAAVARPRAAPRPWGLNVMLVDDDPADSSLILGLLRRHPSVGAAVAYQHSEQALGDIAAGQRHPDLILLDINMPKLSGFAFKSALSEMAHARCIPVVFLTTSAFARDVEQARQVNACGYIIKPESFDELRRRVDAAIKQTISGKWS